MSLEVQWKIPVHPTDELLEEYSLGRVHEPALAVLEEHLFICESCQARALDLDEFVVLMKTGIASFEEERRTPRGIFYPALAIPKIASANILMIAGMMLAVFSATVALRSTVVPAPVAVPLAAFRGGGAGVDRGSGDGLSSAPAGHPLDLSVSTVTLPPAVGYQLELVNDSGRAVWTGEAKLRGAALSARVPAGPAAGIYWVRLYNSRHELLREFGMRLR